MKLGTRRSLLAWAQSSWVARELERLNPGVKVELVGIDTRGDRIQDVPLQAVQGKEFFVAEIDEALRSRAVDLTVHSMKDLSLERPAEFVCGAVPRRENPRDAVLFGPGAIEKIQQGRPLRIGTSSPRRLENIPPFLAKALPQVAPGGSSPAVELVEIRGNVNTRLSRVHEPEGSPKRLDGVVLALAGLIRLWNDEKGRAELELLLKGVRWMILPLRECPAAPAQGALAVECRRDDGAVRAALAKLHDSRSARGADAERALLAEWGGGCHQRFGATAVESPELGELLYVRGVKPDGSFVEELRWKTPPRPSRGAKGWDGSQWRGSSSITPKPLPSFGGRALFVAHSRALASPELAYGSRVWVSGTASWFRLAARGVWVEGCAEGLGFDDVSGLLREKVLGLPGLPEWVILTHDQAVDGWKEGRVISTYSLAPEYPAEARESLAKATHFFWSSGSQFDRLAASVPGGADHACGPGKTARHLRGKGLNPAVFPSVEEWRRWLSSA